MAKTIRLSVHGLSRLINESVKRKLREAATVAHDDWDYFVEKTAQYLQDDIDMDGWALADVVFHPSPDEEVRALRADPSGVPRDLIEKYAAQYGLDSDDLQAAFDEALSAAEEYSSDEEEDEMPPEETVYDRADPLTSGQGVTLTSLGPDIVQQYTQWQQTSPDAQAHGYNYGPDEPVFFVDPVDGLIVGYDIEDNNYFTMRMPGMEEFVDFDGDEMMP